MDQTILVKILEGALMAAGKPLSVKNLQDLFEEEERPSNDDIKAALAEIDSACEDRGFELREVASGYRFQVREALAPWVGRLWEEKPQRYSRALLETLALIAYRQPITRGDIEDIRGVAVSSQIVKTLLEREWVRVVGHKDVPGRPAMYATTRNFLDYFNLRNLDQLPNLAEIADLDSLNGELQLDADFATASATAGSDAADGPSGDDIDADVDADVDADADADADGQGESGDGDAPGAEFNTDAESADAEDAHPTASADPAVEER